MKDCVLGIDIGATNIAFGLVNEAGDILMEESFPTRKFDLPTDFVKFIVDYMSDKNKDYHIVFVTTQGVPFKYGHERVKTDLKAIEALENYLKRHKVIEAELNGSIVAV